MNKKHSNLILVGFMGSGKTTVGKILAKKIEKNFIDTDQLIEKNLNFSIKEFFDKFGEKKFRELETETLKNLSSIQESIISIGGGAFCNNNNIQIIKEIGLTFYLKISFENLLKRFNYEQIEKRPLLKNLDKAEQLLYDREKYYSQADFIINTDNLSPNNIANLIIDKI